MYPRYNFRYLLHIFHCNPLIYFIIQYYRYIVNDFPVIYTFFGHNIKVLLLSSERRWISTPAFAYSSFLRGNHLHVPY